MTIKEIEKQLMISRANIRFYEKEGLLLPDRKENRYRDYTAQDISRLQKIIVLRKIWVPLAVIKSIFDGTKSLQEVIHNQTDFLSDKIDELKGALEVCRRIEGDNVEIDSSNERYYIDLIRNKEKQGQSFIDICKDYLYFERVLFENMWKWVFLYSFKHHKNKYELIKVFLFVFIILIAQGLISHFVWKQSFWIVLLPPLIVFLCTSLIMLIIYLIKWKEQKLAAVLVNIFLIATVTIIAAFFISLIAMLLYALICTIF